MNNTINISQQNVTLASAQRAVADNINGYFAVVSFYAASTSGNRPNATGLTVQFDTRLKVIGAEEGEVFQQRIYNSEGLPVTSRGRSGISEEPCGVNKYFVTTANREPYTEDGYLYFACVQFPAAVEVGDVYTITICTGTDDEFLFEDSTASNEDRATMNAWTKANGIINGRITIVE